MGFEYLELLYCLANNKRKRIRLISIMIKEVTYVIDLNMHLPTEE